MPCKVENGCSPSATCVQGKCDHVDQGVLYKRAYDLAASGVTVPTFDVAVAAKDGGLWLMYRRSSSQLKLMRLDKWGNVVWDRHLNDSYYGSAGSLQELPDGSALLVWSYRPGSGYLVRPRLQALSASGYAVSTYDYPYGNTYDDSWAGHATPVAPLMFSDNTRGVVGTFTWLSGYSSVDVLRAQPARSPACLAGQAAL